MLTWLDYLSRRFMEIPGETFHQGDPRKALAHTIAMTFAEGNGIGECDDKMDNLFLSMLAPFAAPYIGSGAVLRFIDGTPFERPLGIVLTRKTAELLTATKNPAIRDEMWRERLGSRRAIYIDIPHGAFIFRNEAGERVQLRAILAAPFLPTDHPGYTQFFVQVTAVGSENGRGRFIGILHPTGKISFLGYDNGQPMCEPGLFSDSDTSMRKGVLCFSGTFLRMVLCYYLFAPRETRKDVTVTASKRLKKGKPRSGQSLFAMTRLHPTEKVGRTSSSAHGSWSLSERQEVAGHFKLQAYGPDHSLRRMIWVSDYERGPEDAPLRPKGVRI
ncbi:hypothetical protein [Caballeronia sp. TF1N1]|uniref:hypothetical protein n=1 Tax=Caballeronia sp. TF1N1 TaxID=2878153 RepID=UPI001FCFAB28|nr:hypothetical protein [Caballeronia sp. TF1N1]